jgi:hypothetical protein
MAQLAPGPPHLATPRGSAPPGRLAIARLPREQTHRAPARLHDRPHSPAAASLAQISPANRAHARRGSVNQDTPIPYINPCPESPEASARRASLSFAAALPLFLHTALLPFFSLPLSTAATRRRIWLHR